MRDRNVSRLHKYRNVNLQNFTMKPFSLLAAYIAATLFITSAGRAADTAPASSDTSALQETQPTQPALSPRQAAILKRFDKNGDGKLDENEKAAARAAGEKRRAAGKGKLHERILQRFDKNGDGVLDDAERTAALAELETRPNFIKRFDKDGDGKLSPEERAAAEQALRERFAQRRN
jgi:Ca2+-binding EF-hand superfamily protein